MISDFVKGKKKYEYAPQILKGIDLHRAIDTFTDNHTVNKEAARIFKPAYGLYSAAMLDVAYDHFLAVMLSSEGDEAFYDFTVSVYDILSTYNAIFPAAFRSLFPYMKEHNWLYNYRFSFGMRNSFEGLAHRARYLNEGHTAFSLFQNNYELLRNAFNEFFPQLRQFSLEKFSDIH